MKPAPIGHMRCPECDVDGAEIKRDKSGHPYRYCPDCNAQYFTRGDPRRVANLLRKMTPAPAAAAAEAVPATPAPAHSAKGAETLPAPAPKPARKSATLFG